MPVVIKAIISRIIEGVNGSLDAVINPLNVAAGYIDQISKGIIPAKITHPYHGDFNTIKNNINNLIDILNDFSSAQMEMNKQHGLGAIDETISIEQFPGVYRAMADNINQLVASHIAVKMRVVDVVKKYARGDFSDDMDRLPGKKAPKSPLRSMASRQACKPFSKKSCYWLTQRLPESLKRARMPINLSTPSKRWPMA